MTTPEKEVCVLCRHPRSEHIAPDGHRLYWRCTRHIGHPWDGPCECHEVTPRWVSAKTFGYD